MTRPIDVVIAVAKALQDWDGSPEQAAEKLGAAARAVQDYSTRFLDPTGGIAYYQGKFEEAMAEISRLNALVAHPQPSGLREAAIIDIPGPCDASCEHRWTSFEYMKEPCASCQHIHVVERGVSCHTNYKARAALAQADQEVQG